MARAFHPKIATANHLLEGDVVYFTGQGDWSRSIGHAVVAPDAQAADRLLAAASAQGRDVVGIYLAEVTVSEAGHAPLHFREQFRTKGPSNYFHGKQAEV